MQMCEKKKQKRKRREMSFYEWCLLCMWIWIWIWLKRGWLNRMIASNIIERHSHITYFSHRVSKNKIYLSFTSNPIRKYFHTHFIAAKQSFIEGDATTSNWKKKLDVSNAKHKAKSLSLEIVCANIACTNSTSTDHSIRFVYDFSFLLSIFVSLSLSHFHNDISNRVFNIRPHFVCSWVCMYDVVWVCVHNKLFSLLCMIIIMRGMFSFFFLSLQSI